MVSFNPPEWWINAEDTMHVCYNRDMFTTFESVQNGQTLFMENATTSTIEGKEIVSLKMTSKKQLTLKDVLHVPEI